MSTSVMEAPAVMRNEAVEPLIQAATGFMYTAAVYQAAKLGIADLLAEGPRPVSRLAEESGTNEDALYRVLRALATAGIFKETTPRTFDLTPAAAALQSGVPGSLRDLAVWLGNRFHFHVFAEMEHSLRTGRPAVEYVYGKPCFESLAEMPEVAREFNDAMTGISARVAPAVADAYDFSCIDTMVDVAGGHGRTLCEILERYPAMKGVVFDLEAVVEGAKEAIRRRGLERRCKTAAGNFFESVPPGADCYYMQHIIHDWDDEAALKILENCRRALEGKPGGRLVIVDAVLPENGTPHMAKLIDLEMLLMPGGRERTAREWRELLAQAGFRIAQIVETAAPESVIEARPR